MGARLPTVGGTRETDGPAGPFSESPARAAAPVVSVVPVVSTVSVAPFACALVTGLSRAGAVPAALVWSAHGGARAELTWDGFPEVSLPRALEDAGAQPVARLRVAAPDAPEALAKAMEALARARWIVAVGAVVPALYATRLTVLVTGGLPPQAWDPYPRRLRGRAGLLLGDARPRVASALGAQLAAIA